jgi:FkbM family methyltransferase
LVNIFSRSTAWLQRFSASADTLGLRNALEIFFLARLSSKTRSIQLPGGLRFFFRGSSDLGVISHFYRRGYYIEDMVSHPIKRIVDCGANIGTEAARFLIHYPKAQVVAIEAEQANFDCLQRNQASDGRLTIIRGAVWPSDARLAVAPDPNHPGCNQAYLVVEATEGSNTVPAWTIAGIMRKMEWDSIDILKLDIEGAEYELFSSNVESWISHVGAIIFEVPDQDRPGTTQVILNALRTFPFNYYLCGENLVLIRSELPWKFHIVPGFRNSRAVSLG